MSFGKKKKAIGKPKIVGVVNITEDSFSDGGLYLDSDRAIAYCKKLLRDGADIIELGPASSHPDSKMVSYDEEIRRLEPVIERLLSDRVAVCVDSFQPETHRYSVKCGVAYLNDTDGFAHCEFPSELVNATCRLVVMHSVQRSGRANRIERNPREVLTSIYQFFGERLGLLESVGIRRDRIILDPGMGFFLGSNAEPSIAVLQDIGHLREYFGLPVLISVSRKSFLGTLTGKTVQERGPASLAAEIFAASQSVDYIRTHDVGALCDALKVLSVLTT